MTTKILKEYLRKRKLTFKLPKELTGNDKDLTIVVHPSNPKKDPHKVFVNGVYQYKLYGTPLEKMWFKPKKEQNPWFDNFQRDWRFLLSLDNYPQSHEWSNDAVVPLWVKSKQTPKPDNKSRSHKPVPKYTIYSKNKPVELVCIKDLNTGGIERIPKNQASKLVVEYGHYDYCDKQEWRKQYRKLHPIVPSDYWSETPFSTKDEEGKDKVYEKVFIPAIKKDKPIKVKYLVKGKKLVARPNPTTHKHNLIPTYDRHVKLQTIRIEPPAEESIQIGDYIIDTIKQEKFTYKQLIPKVVYIPIYGRSGHNKNTLFKYKKIFVENIEKDVTFMRTMRTIYKTIVTKQYPPELCEYRRIIKKNMQLLRQQEDEQKNQQQTSE